MKLVDTKPTHAAPLVSQKPSSFSMELQHLALTFAGRHIRVSELIEGTQGRGYLIALMVIAVPFLTPIPLPGFSIPFGVGATLIGGRMAAGRKPWLPKRLLDRELPPQFVARLLGGASRVVRWLEFFLKPRLIFLHEWVVFRRVAGLLIMLSGMLLLLPLPLPFSNSLPALTVLLLAAGSLERDGLFFLAGCFMFLVSVAYFTFLFFGGAHVVGSFWRRMMTNS